MTKNKVKKITLDDLIARKTQGKLDKLQIKYYNSEELGGEIEIRKISLKKYMSLISGIDSDDGEESLEFMCELIYECCPIFKENSKQLMEVYECGEATESPLLVLNDNMGEMKEICEIINGFYGLDKIQETVKN